MSTEEEDLALIPRVVRDKLDRVGLKVHLADWEKLTLEERRQLRDRACETGDEIEHYRRDLVALVLERTGREPGKLAGAPPADRSRHE